MVTYTVSVMPVRMGYDTVPDFAFLPVFPFRVGLPLNHNMSFIPLPAAWGLRRGWHGKGQDAEVYAGTTRVRLTVSHLLTYLATRIQAPSREVLCK